MDEQVLKKEGACKEAYGRKQLPFYGSGEAVAEGDDEDEQGKRETEKVVDKEVLEREKKQGEQKKGDAGVVECKEDEETEERVEALGVGDEKCSAIEPEEKYYKEVGNGLGYEVKNKHKHPLVQG